jgi:hypothetical protein
VTSIVGVLCRDGVVIGTDSSATLFSGNQPTIEQPFEKIVIIGENIIIAGTGEIGLGQRFCNVVDKYRLNPGRLHLLPALDICREFSRNTIQDFSYTFAKQGQYGALVGFISREGPGLCEFGVDNFQPELITERFWYCSMGSAQGITDGFLAFIRDVFWVDGQPNINEAIFSVTWTLDHAIRINPGGVNAPVRIGVIQKPDPAGHYVARLLDESELFEHRQNIDDAKGELRKFREKFNPEGAPDIPRPH